MLTTKHIPGARRIRAMLDQSDRSKAAHPAQTVTAAFASYKRYAFTGAPENHPDFPHFEAGWNAAQESRK